MARVVVIGAGVSGLSTAEFLSDDHEVVVLEAGSRIGGSITTDVHDGFVFNRGANGWLDDEPAVGRLLERLGLTPLEHLPGPRYVVKDQALVELPGGPGAFLTSPILPLMGRLRVFCEPFMPTGPDDESVAQYARRRVGQAALDGLVGPMVSGVWAGDPRALSVTAAFPKMKKMEREHGSIFGYMRAHKGKKPAQLQSLPGGTGDLPDAIARRVEVRTGVRVTGVTPGWTVETTEGSMPADAVVMAAPADAARQILAPLDPELGGRLGAIPHAAVAVVSLGLPRGSWCPHGFGALVPRSEPLGVLGVLFTGSTWEGSCPADGFGLRCILGGALNPMQAGLDPQELLAIAMRDVRTLLGDVPDPTVHQVVKHPRGIPQYTIGHLSREVGIREREDSWPGLFLVGSYLGGPAVKSCIANGERMADEVRAWLA